MEPVLVGLGGAAGALFRYGVGRLVGDRSFPWATLVVNALGSFVLGVVVVAGLDEGALLLLGVGFCGAFTTFSSFSVQTVALWERGHRGLAAVNAASNLVVSLVAFYGGWLIGS